MNPAPTQTFAFTDFVRLFHGLSGICVGWAWGARFNLLSGVMLACLGCVAGCLVGFLCSKLPRAVCFARTAAPRKHRFLAGAFGLAGAVLTTAFWWAFVAVFITDAS